MLSTELRGTIEEWLQEIGYTVQVIEEKGDQVASWRLAIDHPLKGENRLQIVGPKNQPDAVVIAQGSQFPHEFRDAFERMSDDDKAELLWAMRHALNRSEVEFQLVGMTGDLDCPRMVEVSATRYADGLTKDSFMATIGTVFKTFLAGMWCAKQRMGGGDSGPGGRFDFKRLGL